MSTITFSPLASSSPILPSESRRVYPPFLGGKFELNLFTSQGCFIPSMNSAAPLGSRVIGLGILPASSRDRPIRYGLQRLCERDDLGAARVDRDTREQRGAHHSRRAVRQGASLLARSHRSSSCATRFRAASTSPGSLSTSKAAIDSPHIDNARSISPRVASTSTIYPSVIARDRTSPSCSYTGSSSRAGPQRLVHLASHRQHVGDLAPSVIARGRMSPSRKYTGSTSSRRIRSASSHFASRRQHIGNFVAS